MSLQFTINADFLDSIDPPLTFPPDQEDLVMQIQNKFIGECDRFISNEKILYKCSKSIQNRLKIILKKSQDIEIKLSSQNQKLIYIAQQLKKYKTHEVVLKDRQAILKMLCQLIKMQEVRKQLLLSDSKKEAEELQSKSMMINEQEYLTKLQRLSLIIQQSQSISYLRDEFPLIKQIILQLQTIYQSAIKLIIKKLLTPKMVALILTQYYHIFLKQKTASQMFYNAIAANRLQHMKISLNPMINNLNYATNIPELYQSILVTWQKLIQQQLNLFKICQRQDLIKTVTEQLLTELLGKMEKNIFRIKDLISVVRIRKYFNDFLHSIRNIQIWNIKNETKQQKEWELLSGVVSKCDIIVQSKLSQQSQFLQNTKYNIYTLVSYIPIRQHLQKMKQAYQFSIDNQKIDWEIAFYTLCSSRDPKNYPNNKSLIIFNLNIWYLYLKIILNGKHRKEGEQLMKWAQQIFSNFNVLQASKKYYQSFEKILQLCGNISAFKTTLYSQLQLLGHQQLRKQIAAIIKMKYLDCYEKILLKIEKSPMTNEQVKVFCHQKKINLNKFGKYSHSICIHSRQELNELLEYV